MKHYSEKTDHWMKHKALGYFINFINNHNDSIQDDDTFSLVGDLIRHSEWLTRIQKAFTAKELLDFQNAKCKRNRLDFEEAPQEMLCEIWNNATSRKKLRLLLGDVTACYLQGKELECFSSEVFPQKVSELQRTLGLSDFEMDVLLVLAFVGRGLLTIPGGRRYYSDEGNRVVFISKCLDCDPFSVFEAVAEKGKLRRYECIDDELDFNGKLYGFLNGINNEPLTNSYFRRDKSEVLPWEFYGELAKKHGEILKNMIRIGSRSSGINILLYGAPGTGKTSFAKTLAAELGLECFCIAQNTGDDCSGRSCSTPEFRFGALQICDSQIDPTRSLLIVDEADDMLRSGGPTFWGGIGRMSAGDKGLLNSVLDTIRTPTVWITNTPACELDESSRRRFDYSIRFDPLNGTQRLAIWKNNVAKLKLTAMFDEAMLEKFSEQYAVSAGGIALILRNVAKLNPGKKDIPNLVEQLMKPHCELLDIPSENGKLLPGEDYSLDGLNIKGDIQIKRITEALGNFQTAKVKDLDSPRMNLLLHGAPGTGKTEFVKYLGQALNTKVVVKMGSDLLSKFIGETEQNIRRAFAEAQEEKAILFLDEIDGLVQSRERAQRSWEVTQVNELLHCMENFSGIMIGATNFSANLDAAILRRFTFKLEFDYLNASGKILFFERMFRTELTEPERKRLELITDLTPGDFRTVRQSLFYLGGTVSNMERLSALEREVLIKKQNSFSVKAKIGF